MPAVLPVYRRYLKILNLEIVPLPLSKDIKNYQAKSQIKMSLFLHLP